MRPISVHSLYGATGRCRAVCSFGSRGDSYDNALAGAVNGLYTAEVIRKNGPWRSLEQVELATAEWVDWWNQRRLHGAVSDIPPAEFEALNYRSTAPLTRPDSKPPSLHKTQGSQVAVILRPHLAHTALC